MKIRLHWVGLVLIGLLAFSACTRSNTGSATGTTSAGTSGSGGTLYIYTWSDYTDPDVIKQFEQEYNVKVVLDTFDTNEDMIAKVRVGNSGYDIVVPSDYAVDLMAREQLLALLDKAKLPNVKNMLPANMGQYFDPQNTYSVPYLYGMTGIAYNKKIFTTPPDSWAALFDTARLEPYKGKISMLDDEREAPGAVLRYLGKSVNDTDAAVLKQVQDILVAQKPFLTAYNSNDVNRKLVNGEYVISQAYNGMALQAILGLGSEFPGNPDIGWVLPKEGGIIWQDNLAIVKDSRNIELAHTFIDFAMRPEIAVKNSTYVGYLTPNAGAVDQLPKALKDLYAQGFAPDAEMYKRLERAKVTEGSAALTQLWTVVKSK